MAQDPTAKLRRIRAAAEAHFGERVLDILTPGGTERASCRLILDGRTVIATHRVNFRRTHLEAMMLGRLAPLCDAVPQFLGLHDDTLFQSDVGRDRLNVAIAGAEGAAREDLADQAVDAIFRYQGVARKVQDDMPLPPLGASPAWVRGLVEAVDVLRPIGPGVPAGFDGDAAAERLMTPPRQFVKWDCRSGNAALDEDGALRWFDFEYCGLRHGAEDVAWLIADEAWPVGPETMLRIVRDNHRDHVGGTADAYVGYLSFYTTFHALQRLGLILSEVRGRGWRSKAQIRARDDVGIHPEFAQNICRIGAFFAERDPLTRLLVPAFEKAADDFAALQRGARVA
jgi:hypothetical protein